MILSFSVLKIKPSFSHFLTYFLWLLPNFCQNSSFVSFKEIFMVTNLESLFFCNNFLEIIFLGGVSIVFIKSFKEILEVDKIPA